MPRRLALALSLAFTTIVTFSLVALGASAGFFSDAKKSATTQKAHASDQQPKTDDANAALRYLAAVADQTAQAGHAGSASPRVLTEYVYVYETPVPGAPRRAQPQTQAASAPTKPQAAASADTAPDDHGGQASGGDGEQEHGSTPSAPTSIAPTSTPKPAAAPTQPAAQPTSVPPTAQPTSPPAQATCLDEFVSRVASRSAISGGSLVTWSNGVQTRVLDSTPHAAALQVGVLAHVHATTAGGCTVTEIELDD